MPSILEAAGMILLILLAAIIGMFLLVVIAALLQVGWNWARWGNPYGKTGKPPAKRTAAASPSPTVVIVPSKKGPQK